MCKNIKKAKFTQFLYFEVFKLVLKNNKEIIFLFSQLGLKE